ncbi:molybdenum cofactor guanylyltransferase [Paenibacillus xylaniclasticus]|uniref:molybdenum cofactor guanylyltransferase n=1 Tax=Paenibacillus xylaniclasticus TaxID=588083 RepID=UPI000FDC7033|nr:MULTISPECIES: molybdenum cofactor guanylyltransferase [Paenibacillus]GFN32177.1 hypothetical protein PCURB6_24370 [Paenibacillus curdlanolyticus]
MLSGVILAGGASRRMGGERKALLPFGGKPLIVRQLERMAKLCDECIIVTDDPKPYLPVVDRSVRIITDFYEEVGPLGGLHAALSLAKHSSVWAVGCDMPFISDEAARLLFNRKKDGFEAVVPLVNGELHPLHGIYDRAAAPHIETVLKQGESELTELLKLLLWSEISETELAENGIDPICVAAFKTPDEYETMLQQAEQLQP